MNDLDLLRKSSAKIEEINRRASLEVAEEYKNLVKVFAKKHQVTEPEAQYLIFQTNIKLKEEEA